MQCRCRWAQDNGVQTVLQPAVFSGNIRGLSAAGDLEAGTEGIRVPQALLISEEAARQSDLVCLQEFGRVHNVL